MANFVPSALVAGQAKFSDRMLGGEWRLPDSAALSTAETGGVANPMLIDLRTREDRTINAYFPIRQAAISGTARAHDHTGAAGDSLAQPITWSTFSEPFSISLKQGDNNLFAFSEMYASSKRNAVYNLLDRLDAWFVAALQAARTQVNNGGGKGTFNSTDDQYEVPLAEINYFYQNCKQSLRYNLFRGELIGIVDDAAMTLAQRLSEQGSANATNYGFQFSGMQIFDTTRTIASGYDGSAMFFENGLVAVIPWIPVQNRKPIDPNKAASYLGDYGSFTIAEWPGVQFAEHVYATRADGSGVGGYTQDELFQVEISIDVGFVDAPLSTYRSANDSVIYGCGQLAS